MADTVIELKLQPRSSTNEIIGFRNNILWAKTTAPPVDFEANSKLLKMLSKALDVPKMDITIIKGLRNKYKVIKITGLSRDEVIAKLTPPEEKPE